ncbi:SDR family NAD(P)-dependent oxidoreductase [Phreatobacter oligotrophus]|uniref:NAD(P)-dependent dehydrogenase (Short-subunit alcohol dehydrogenase family) n=1 Tax=Phreatobacter oligotrophus TaxID=1122261 RepID=A0A2T4ZFU3_9HYPH|nr:SDR family NAD(P)-dependent oxidoreductase [Phreatobacter oligotrophus]PTM60792.1 NAD(P)-dependent dehydrogenase (short-subunit alcohol dehydrogenase family) [Phreatobacter oligotrophus]
MHDLTGKVAFISGAGSVGEGWGNGKATAVLLARQGATIYGTDITLAAAEETQRLIAAEGGTAHAAAVDMTKAAQVEAAVADCLARFGRIDILVNNVGGSAPGDPVAMSEEVWDAQLDLNLKTAFLACKHVIPVMERQGGGAIVNLSSIAGVRVLPDRPHVAYTTTKLGILGFSRSIAVTYAKQQIRCNTVIPGLMHTPLVETRLAKTIAGGDVAALIASRNAQVPTGKMGDAWDVAQAVLFLVSDEARYVTAAEIAVDGGLSAASR